MTVQVFVVTGLSGAGRSTALNVLEDLGYYCVDNLPPELAPRLVEMASAGGLERLALGMDVRTGEFLAGTEGVIGTLRDEGHMVEVLFFDCNTQVLIRRYSESRRPHPLAPGGDLTSAIKAERARLATLRVDAAQIFDTTRMSVHDLKRALVDHLQHLERGPDWRMVTRIVSFGFKYGLPADADLVFDLRFLPNPHHDRALRPQTGLDAPVSEFVLGQTEAQELLEDVSQLLRRTLPRYQREGKAYLTIAIGCTGGRHRSVAVSEELARRFRDEHEVVVAHRDVERAGPRPKPAEGT